jgi:hypothetical protein
LSPKPRYQHHRDILPLSPPRSPPYSKKQFY